MTPKVLIAEADDTTRVGLRVLLDRSGFDVAAEAGAAEAAVEAARIERVDLALIAAGLPGGGVNATRHLRALQPGLRVVVLTHRASGEELVEAVWAGAVGYVGQDIAGERLPHVLRAVLDGEIAIPRRHTAHLIEELRGRDARRALLAARTGATLTERQWEVLQLLAADASTGEMALRLAISEVTVRRHISTLRRKLGVKDRSGAAALLRWRSPD